MPRFTISHHTGSKEGDHYDLMFEQDAGLKTWRFRTLPLAVAQPAEQIKDHRAAYLDYEGEVSGDRGRVRIWDTGQYLVDAWTEKAVRVAVVGRQLRTRLRLDADKPGGPNWTLQDPTGPVRKAAASFLREAGLEDAPSPELEEVRRALSHEEQQLMAVVDQFTRGGAVEWTLAETDAALRKRIDSEHARWKHPWLAAGKSFASRLDDLAKLLRGARA